MTTIESPKQKFPAISVLLSVYNSEKYVAIAIESILNQTFADFELIIVDDRSTDSSWDIVQRYAKQDKRIIVFRNEVNLGGCNTLIKGLEFCTGKYYARLDNDDWSYPDRLEKQFNFLEAHSDVGIVGGTMEIINKNGDVIGKREYNLSDSEIRKKIFRYSPFSHPLVMIRKSILDKVGGYDPEYAPADDYEMYFRIGRESKFANLADVILQYRMTPGSITFNRTKKMELSTIKVRNLYKKDHSYKFSWTDQLYNWMHYLSIFVIPPKVKIYIFNLLRNSR